MVLNILTQYPPASFSGQRRATLGSATHPLRAHHSASQQATSPTQTASDSCSRFKRVAHRHSAAVPQEQLWCRQRQIPRRRCLLTTRVNIQSCTSLPASASPVRNQQQHPQHRDSAHRRKGAAAVPKEPEPEPEPEQPQGWAMIGGPTCRTLVSIRMAITTKRFCSPRPRRFRPKCQLARPPAARMRRAMLGTSSK